MRSVKFQSWVIWAAVSTFSLLQFFLQVATNMMTDQFASSFHINTTYVGILSAAFFWAYLLVQIPAGIMFDRYGMRKVLICAASLMGVGCITFALSPNFTIAFISRLLMGFGAGFAFIGMLFAIAKWFPGHLFPVMVGLGEFVGMVGTAIGQLFAPHLVLHFNWRLVIWIVALLTFLVVVVMWLVLRDKPSEKKSELVDDRQIWQRLLVVLQTPEVWLAGIFCLGTFVILAALADVWIVPFLEHVYQTSYIMATRGTLVILCGIAIGGPAWGWLAKKLGSPKTVMFFGAVTTLVTILLVMFFTAMSLASLYALLFLLGFACSVYLLAFTVVTSVVPAEICGAAMAFCNVLCLLGAVIFQPLIGYFIAHGYSYQVAFACVPIAVVVAIVCLSLLRTGVPNQAKE